MRLHRDKSYEALKVKKQCEKRWSQTKILHFKASARGTSVAQWSERCPFTSEVAGSFLSEDVPQGS